jgi:hydrogenase maturation protease
VVFACGNPSRGDDALGPALMRRVQEWNRRHPDRPVETVEDFQLQVEHALDLEGRDLALFVDAAAIAPEAVSLRRVGPSVCPSFSTHALSPSALLAAFVNLVGDPPPPAFSLGVRGEAFELGQPLSREAAANLDEAWDRLQHLLADPSEHAWEGMCTPGPSFGESARLEFRPSPRNESACSRRAPHRPSSLASPRSRRA